MGSPTVAKKPVTTSCIAHWDHEFQTGTVKHESCQIGVLGLVALDRRGFHAKVATCRLPRDPVPDSETKPIPERKRKIGFRSVVADPPII